jgi:outer membrane protein OmpA-like peptidoglycan-associated protein
MRFSFGLVLALSACGVAHAQEATTPATDENGVTINMDALSEETAQPQTELEKLRPLARVRPRPKPEFSIATVPLPRPKPELAAAPASVVPAKPLVQAPAPSSSAPPKAEAPVTIVENFPVEMSGVATDPFASNKPFSPVAGFAVLSRIRFARGLSQMPSAAFAILDAVALRLLESNERVRLAAFSGKTGDMSSASRRLSLERARVVREYLVSKGVAMDRVDVLPFGGAVDGITDRVDVLASGT